MRFSSKLRVIFFAVLLIGQSLIACICPLPSQALDLDSMLEQGIKNQLLPGANQINNNAAGISGSPFSGPTQQSPIKVDRKTQRIEDLIQHQDIPYGFAPMIPLQGISIAGLGQKAILSLGENYFVVRSNTDTVRMSDIYRDNRLAGKANFVTMDSVMHPYLAFTNRVYAEIIRKQLLPIMKTLLFSMLKVAVNDYKQADDAEVRADIECNVAFMSLALKLLDNSFAIPAIGRVPQLVQADYDAVVFAKPGRSAIFDRNEDFSYYRPVGWYRTSPELFTYYRVKTWLSRMNYPINDVTYDSGGVKANNFRRSVLLYRSLDLARVDGKPAMEYWMKLVKGMFVLGAQVESWQEKNLYPHDYKSVFKTNSADLRMTLSALSEPLYRTKLLLAVRKQKPLTLGSTSIFDLEEEKATKQQVAAFRFIPETGAPEGPWLRYVANLYPKPQLSTNVFPVALLDLNAWGAPQAGNSLLDASWAMDESMPKTVSELKHWVLRRGLAGQVQPVDCRIWNMLTPSWRLLPDGIQTALRGQMWATRRLETVFAAWLDNQVAIAPLRYSSAKPAADGLPGKAADAKDNSTEDGIGEALAHVPASAGSNGSGKSVSGLKAQATGKTVASLSPSKASAGQNAVARLRQGQPNTQGKGVGNSTSGASSGAGALGAAKSAAGASSLNSSGGAAGARAGAAGAGAAGAAGAGAAGAGAAGAGAAGAGAAGAGAAGAGVAGAGGAGAAASGAAGPRGAGTGAAGVGITGDPNTSTTRNAGSVLPAEKKVKPLVARRAARGHFLDPCPDVYNRLLIDTQNLDRELAALGFSLDPNFKRGLDDYARLFQRFFKIAKDEIDCKQLSIEDLNLLGNIDIILDKIDLPLPAVVPVEPQANFGPAVSANARDSSGGFTMALGRPGLLFVILMNKTTREWTLARGAVYTYYEQYGTALSEETLLNKIDRGTIQAPYWAEHFDYVQADKK